MSVASLAVTVALAVGLSACGSSSSSSSSTAAASANSATAQQARLNLAKCFRAHGINVPDPSSNGGPAAGGSLFRTLRNYSQAQVTAARKACQQSSRRRSRRAKQPQQRAQLQQQLVKFAQCMRSMASTSPTRRSITTAPPVAVAVALASAAAPVGQRNAWRSRPR